MSTTMPLREASASRALESRLERAYRLYARRVARCRTPNQRNRLHIALESYMTPLEVRYLAATLAHEPPESHERRWSARLLSYMMSRLARSTDFIRESPQRAVTRYTNGVGTPKEKTLLLCFAGIFHRLMVPTSTFLDCLDPVRYDVVLVRDFSKTAFSKGIAGLGDDFFSALRSLGRLVNMEAYRRTVAFGTSAGGFPALLAAIHLELDQGISVAGVDLPEFASWLQGWGVDPAPYAALLASRPEPYPQLLLVYCQNCDKDAAAAKALHQRIPSTLWEAVDCDGHAVLASKLSRGLLPVFVPRLLENARSRAPKPSLTDTRANNP
jgi:hypothetical protein